MNNEEKILSILEQVLEEQRAMRSELTRVAVTQENVVLPRLNLLMEDHNDIKNQIKSLSVIDELKSDVSVLKLAVRTLTDELTQLKAAM